jgi:probable rRNA maturation factor
VIARRAAALAIDVVVGSALWKSQRGVGALVRRAIAAAGAHLGRQGNALGRRTELSVTVLLTDDAAIRGLNRTWRRKNAPTNVLSFPAKAAPGEEAPAFLGDIAIAYETTKREAAAEGKRFADHVTHLVIHGFLHLLGHDHEADAEAETMEALEIAILKRLEVPNPYVARDAKG